MNKCLRISFDARVPMEFLRDRVQKEAQRLGLEGVAQVINSAQKIVIIVSGKKNPIDTFVDHLHRDLAEHAIQDIDVEPFVKVKDYRGVFRVLE